MQAATLVLYKTVTTIQWQVVLTSPIDFDRTYAGELSIELCAL